MSTVITVLTHSDQHTDLAAVRQWLYDNKIDPNTVAPQWISVEQEEGDGSYFIRYRAYKLDVHGNRIPDPDGGNGSWLEERTAPLETELPAELTETPNV